MSKPDYYFHLSKTEQSELLHGLAPILGRRAEILEKDIWLCQSLKLLFALPEHKPMAFKGGTSLSKVYQAIERFSEDIDITIDYQSLVPESPNLEALSISQCKKLSDTLKLKLYEYITQELVPAFSEALPKAFPSCPLSLEISEDAEKLWLRYPSAVENEDTYLNSSILIEFGGRNATLPRDTVTIVPDITSHVSGLFFPSANVAVLSPTRTFGEKATLVHVECHRPNLRVSAERLSRHWYDLARLAHHEIGTKALADKTLLEDVLRIKGAFFRSSYSHYDKCLSGSFKLIPPEPLLAALHEDYQAMLNAQMFYGHTLAFDQIVERLTTLEQRINETVCD